MSCFVWTHGTFSFDRKSDHQTSFSRNIGPLRLGAAREFCGTQRSLQPLNSSTFSWKSCHSVPCACPLFNFNALVIYIYIYTYTCVCVCVCVLLWWQHQFCRLKRRGKTANSILVRKKWMCCGVHWNFVLKCHFYYHLFFIINKKNY